MIGVRPGRDGFVAAAREHALVPVVTDVLADLVTPLSVYDRLRGGGPTFLLESVERGERWGRHSFIGLDPVATLSSKAGAVRLDGTLPARVARPVREAAGGGDPLAALQALLDALCPPELDGLPPLFAGAVGYLGWDLVHAIERLPRQAVDDLGHDDVRLVVPGRLLAFDHLRQRLTVVTNVVVDPGDLDAAVARYDQVAAAVEALLDRLRAPVAQPVVAPPDVRPVTDAASNTTRADFLATVETAKEHIRAGDVFQVVPSQRFALDTDVDPLLAYRVLRVLNPSPYMYLFEWDDLQIVGSSPESLVTASDGTAQIWPIAGSRPRGRDPQEDDRLEAELRDDAKERAEHVMLVDLARNDLGRVSEVGTVEVADFMRVVRYSHVMHLVSRVTGRVREGVPATEVLRASFPPGTLSGAPKVRALEIIDALEPTRRGVYGGGIGYLDVRGAMDVCIAIRTVVFSGGTAYVQAGAGIVADSVPESEHAESLAKAAGLLAAVRAAERLRDAVGRPA